VFVYKGDDDEAAMQSDAITCPVTELGHESVLKTEIVYPK
jgi:hypothetical protein